MNEQKDSFKIIYEDSICNVFLHEAPSNDGHAIIVPKTHYLILEEVPDNELEHMFIIANRISITVFENLGAHGTNILINNGPAAGQEFTHFMINVIPRYDNDGINFDWEMKQAKPENLKMSQDLIEENINKVIYEDKNVAVESKTESVDEESLMVKQLYRMP